jgi:hypothetical protein
MDMVEAATFTAIQLCRYPVGQPCRHFLDGLSRFLSFKPRHAVPQAWLVPIIAEITAAAVAANGKVSS